MEPDDPLQTAWRKRLRLDQGEIGDTLEAGLETTNEGGSAEDRIRLAHERMRMLVIENFGADAALLEAVAKIELTGKEAVSVLENGDRAPSPDEYSSLEAIVAFDGSRPSFLLKEDRIDFDSSWCTSQWKTTLSLHENSLAEFSACVGRVENGEVGIATVFLVTPTLAITNRHVAQMIAEFDGQTITVKKNIYVDFGREYKGRPTYDRRKVCRVLFAGRHKVEVPIDHSKLDLAVLELSPSTLNKESADRYLKIGTNSGSISEGFVLATVGYPSDWKQYTPRELRTQYEEVIARLLDGDSGSKRLAPGSCTGMLTPSADSPSWTVTHDATTINGNSGSPLAIVQGAGTLNAVGLHYGGRWQGERTNWAHVLADCLDAEVIPDNLSLRAALIACGVSI